MVDHQLETRGSADAFDSFAELQRAHLKMMTFEERQRSIVGDSNSESKARELIQEFIQKVRNTGMRIGDATERHAAQNILNYWSAETISIDDLSRNDLSPTKLLPFVPSLAQGQAATQSADEINRLKDARKKIQMGATARLYKESGADGYLLHGDALREAETLSKDDRDIADLVAASLKASQQKLKRQRWVGIIIAVIMTMLAIAAVGASILAVKGWQTSARNQELALEAIIRVSKVVKDQVDTGTISTEAARRILATDEIEKLMTVPKEVVAEKTKAPAMGIDLLTGLVASLQTSLAAVIERPAILTATRIELLTAASDIRELMGNDDEARSYAKEAVAMAQPWLNEHPGDSQRKRLLYESAFRYGDLLEAEGEFDEAGKEYDVALECATELTNGSDRSKWLGNVAFIDNKRGDIFLEKKEKDWVKAKAAFDNAFTIGKNLVKNEPADPYAQKTLGDASARLGDYFRKLYDSDKNVHQYLDEALHQYQEVLTIRKSLAEGRPSNIIYQSNLAKAYELIGDVYLRDERFEQAHLHYENALNVKRRLAESDPDNTTWQVALANLYAKIADLLIAKQDSAGGINNYSMALIIWEKLVSIDKGNVGWKQKVASIRDKRARSLAGKQQFDAALNDYDASLGIRKELAYRFPNNADRQGELGEAYERVGDTIFAGSQSQADLQKAINVYQEGLKVIGPLGTLESLRERLQTKVLWAF